MTSKFGLELEERERWLFIYFVPDTTRDCQIFSNKYVIFREVNKFESLLVKFDSFVWSEVLFTLRSTAHHAIQL
jgi:hypothetical protein